MLTLSYAEYADCPCYEQSGAAESTRCPLFGFNGPPHGRKSRRRHQPGAGWARRVQEHATLGRWPTHLLLSRWQNIGLAAGYSRPFLFADFKVSRVGSECRGAKVHTTFTQ